MKDQAEKLRQIIENLKFDGNSKNINTGSEKSENDNKYSQIATRTIAITSGKGGVGKTNFTVNLGITLARMGYKVVLFDADLGLSNVDVLLGFAPKFSLIDVLNNSVNIKDTMISGPYGIKIISGGSGISDLVNLPVEKLDILIASLSQLEENADFLLIDTGAGLGNSVISFLLAASEVICVTTPEPTSITDVYALIKILSYKDKEKKIRVVINKAEDEKEADEIINKLYLVCRRFLDIEVDKLGYVLQDPNVTKAVKMQQPFTMVNPKSLASRNIQSLAEKILDLKVTVTNETGLKSFFSKLLKKF